MAKKHINSSSGAVIGAGYKSKKRVVPYKEPEFLRNLRLNRERHFWKIYPDQRAEIEEYVNYMKSQWALQDKRDEKN